MKKLLLAFLFAFGGAAAAESPVGLPDELRDHVAYYTSFNKEDWNTNPNIERLKVQIDKRNSLIVPGKGIRGDALQGAANSYGQFTFKSPEAGLNLSRTYSIWIRHGDSPTPNSNRRGGGGMLIFEFSSLPETHVGRFDFAASRQTITGRTYGLPGMELTGGSANDFAALCPPGQWNHFAMTSNGQRVTWYANGKKIFGLTLPKPLEPPYIFDRADVGGQNAFLDEFVIFDIALTDEAVAEYHASVRSLLLRESMFE